MKNKFLKIIKKIAYIILEILLFFIIIAVYYYLTNEKSREIFHKTFFVDSDTKIDPNSELAKYVTQEEVDDFAFRYWDIDIDEVKNNPLMENFRQILKSKNTTNILNFMKDNNLSANTELHRGVTPLMYSSFYNDLNTTKELIKLGADVHKKDKYGLSPLAYAIENNSTKTVKILLDNGVKFDERMNIQSYLKAPNYGDIKSIVIDKDNIEIIFEDDYTDKETGSKYNVNPFAYVIYNNYIEIAKYILESGWKGNIKESNKTDDGLYYLNLIYIPNYEPMLDLLLNYNVRKQPSKETMKKAYDECYDFYYDPCFYDYKNKCKSKYNVFPETYGLKNSYEMFRKYCPDKNGTFKNTKDFISYKNSENRSYAISSIFSGSRQDKVYIKDKNITLKDLIINQYNNSKNKDEKDFIKTYYLMNNE